jgi:hypothetical protein
LEQNQIMLCDDQPADGDVKRQEQGGDEQQQRSHRLGGVGGFQVVLEDFFGTRRRNLPVA